MLTTEKLTKSFPLAGRALTVLQDVSLRIEAGDTCAVIGPSGSGKTTLLGLCAGLDRPTAGRVVLDGVELGGLDEEQLARLRLDRTGFVFQTFRLMPSLTALENVMIPAELRGDDDARERARELLVQVGLEDRQTHYPSQMSGGEQQRVALARAFINRPGIIFADEPTGNLDDETGAQVLDLLFDLNRTARTTLLLVTHDQVLTQRVHQVIRLKGGRAVD
jgi:putative ABC transport system ATP-binding protein